MRFGSGAGSKGSLDVGKHGIKGTAQAANLGVGGIVHFHAAGQVTGRDGRSCLFHLGEGGTEGAGNSPGGDEERQHERQ